MSSVNRIFDTFRLTNAEYEELDNKFNRLCYKIFSELKRKNSRNNYTEDLDDVMQDLRISLVRAGCYYKRQTYLEDCMASCRKNLTNHFLLMILTELEDLWLKRTCHGANRQKFGEHQEKALELLVQTLHPNHRPNKNRGLQLDGKFSTYCKAIAWNCEKNIGKKITRERVIRGGLVSLSEHDFLASVCNVF
jgi:hypothetical protein